MSELIKATELFTGPPIPEKLKPVLGGEPQMICIFSLGKCYSFDSEEDMKQYPIDLARERKHLRRLK